MSQNHIFYFLLLDVPSFIWCVSTLIASSCIRCCIYYTIGLSEINTVVGQSLEYLWIQSQDDKEYFIYWLGDPVIKRQLEEENKKYDSET